MRTKQSILEDYGEMEILSIRDIVQPEQKWIHFWDFMELDEKVHEFQAKMAMAIKDLDIDMMKRFRNYYTRAMVQTPDKFLGHNKELREIEFLLENPFFLAILHFALTKDMDENELRYWTIAYKKRVMDRRRGIKEGIEKELKESYGFLTK